MLIAVVSVYNDFPLIKKCIKSIYSYVDQIVCVDGAYTQFPHDIPWSTDGTLEYLEALPKVRLIKTKTAWPSQIEKRSRYLIGSHGDYYLMLDADEWVKNPEILKVHPPADVIRITFVRTMDNFTYTLPKIFKHQPGIHYRHKHYWLHDGEGNSITTLRKTGPKYREAKFLDLIICHDTDLRSSKRQSAKKIYYDFERKTEGKISEE